MNWVLAGLLLALAAGYVGVGLLSPPARRRREAAAIRELLLAEIEAGRRSVHDPGIRRLMEWCHAQETGAARLHTEARVGTQE